MSRRHHPGELEARQHATLPSDVIRRDAGFEGALVKGDRKLTGLQKVGAAVLGFAYLFLPCFLIAQFIGSWRSNTLLSEGPAFVLVWLGAAAVAAGFAYLGIRMLWNTVK